MFVVFVGCRQGRSSAVMEMRTKNFGKILTVFHDRIAASLKTGQVNQEGGRKGAF